VVRAPAYAGGGIAGLWPHADATGIADRAVSPRAFQVPEECRSPGIRGRRSEGAARRPRTATEANRPPVIHPQRTSNKARRGSSNR